MCLKLIQNNYFMREKIKQFFCFHWFIIERNFSKNGKAAIEMKCKKCGKNKIEFL